MYIRDENGISSTIYAKFKFLIRGIYANYMYKWILSSENFPDTA
jgi:hypothetical protein